MSSYTADHVTTERPQQFDERTLRHPRERIVFAVFVVLNFAVLAGAVLVMRMHPPWLGKHPFVDKQIQALRGLALAGAIAAPATVLLRNRRWAETRLNGIQLSPAQIPGLHAILVRECAVFGMTEIPALYLTATESHIARAYTAWGKRTYIALGVSLLQPDLDKISDVMGFHIGREIGRIRLGHTEWWHELLLAYVVRIPILRNPLMHLRTYSADRYGAFLQPDGVRGLVAVASGRLMLPAVDVSESLRHVPEARGFVALLGQLGRPEPPVARRVRELYDLGLFTRTAGPSRPSR